MPSAWTPLANTTLASATTSVTFSSISQSFRDLVLVIEGNPSNTASGYSLAVRFNGSATGYAYLSLSGNGSANSSVSYSNETSAYPAHQAVSGRFNSIVNILDYTATDKNKTMLSRYNQDGSVVSATMNRWNSTAAITSLAVTLQNSSATFAAGTTFSLYGVSA